MGKDLDDLLKILAVGALLLGLSGFFAKPRCPVCKAVLEYKPNVCPYCRTPLRWNA